MKNIIIIGAGPAGITAAYELLKNSGNNKYNITILEESDAIGGISRTVCHNGNRMDIGGHRFFSKDDDVMKWWKSLMPIQGKDSIDDIILCREKPLSPGGPDPQSSDNVMLVRDRVSRIYYLDKFFDYPISMSLQTIKNMGFGRTVKAGLSYIKSSIFKKEEDSLENFYINRFGKVLYEMFFEGYTEKLWGRHPKEISADWGAQRVKGLSVTAVIKDMISKTVHKNKTENEVETSLIEQFIYPKFGPGQLWETAASEIENSGGHILKRHKVEKIICDGNKITAVTCSTPNGEKTFEGDIFISSMPIKDLIADIDGTPVPSDINKIADGLPYRDFVTVGLLLDKLNLKNKTNIKTLGNIVPDCWIYVQDTNVKLGRIQIFNNWSPYMLKDPENTVWIGLEYFCREGDDFWNMDDKSCIKFVSNELQKMNIINSDQVKDAHIERVKKAYPAYFDTYSRIDQVIEYLNGFENLLCIGRNGQHRYNNMDHSMVTAMRASDFINGKITDKNEIWNVNTEQSYHEKK